MEWIDRLNRAIEYIEENLTGKVDYEQLGKIACCSSYHFQRMFSYMAGMPLSEYLRRRKMSLAAVDLRERGAKIIDVAQKYGYSSPTAFNRAFQSVCGVAPSAVKTEGITLTSYSPITFKITVKGVEEMNYRIETRDPFRIVGVWTPMEKEIEKNFETIPLKWQEVSANGTLQRLVQMMDGEPKGVLGVCSSGELWRYYIGVASKMDKGEFEEYLVPAATWAIFSGRGTNQSIQELEQRIVTEWLPTSGYEYGDAPDIEVYLNPDPQNAQYEVWIPVVRRQGEGKP